MNKNIKLFFILLLSLPLLGIAQAKKYPLAQADSLFEAQKFTQSFVLYDSIYQQKQATPAMLLKMAYIKEGLGDYTMAQYYINEYYLATNNDLALEKMEELANEKELAGYETNDLNFILSLYYKHFQWLTLGVMVLVLLVFIFFILQLKKYKRLPPVTTFFLATFLLGLFLLVNFGKTYNKAIVVKNNTFIMEGPSAGAHVVDVISKGNKVNIKGQNDVWLQIEWNGVTGYIKNNTVKKLTIW